MDESVIRAMAKWPNVPAVHGWLSLDRRGVWRVKDDPITNRAANRFIGRNYTCDERGWWYFQNGPQRVFVRLDYTPWVLGLEPDGSLVTHTGRHVHRPSRVLVDEMGCVLVETEFGVGLLSDRDLEAFSNRLADELGQAIDADDAQARLERLACGSDQQLTVQLAGQWVAMERIHSRDVATRFGFEPSPDGDQNA